MRCLSKEFDDVAMKVVEVRDYVVVVVLYVVISAGLQPGRQNYWVLLYFPAENSRFVERRSSFCADAWYKM